MNEYFIYACCIFVLQSKIFFIYIKKNVTLLIKEKKKNNVLALSCLLEFWARNFATTIFNRESLHQSLSLSPLPAKPPSSVLPEMKGKRKSPLSVLPLVSVEPSFYAHWR